jgi:hypothetical protein
VFVGGYEYRGAADEAIGECTLSVGPVKIES